MPLVSPWIRLNEIARTVSNAEHYTNEEDEPSNIPEAIETLRSFIIDFNVNLSGFFIDDFRIKDFSEFDIRHSIGTSYFMNSSINIVKSYIIANESFTYDEILGNYSAYIDVVASRRVFERALFRAMGIIQRGRPTVHNWEQIFVTALMVAEHGVTSLRKFSSHIQAELAHSGVNPPHIDTLKQNVKIKAIYADARKVVPKHLN